MEIHLIIFITMIFNFDIYNKSQLSPKEFICLLMVKNKFYDEIPKYEYGDVLETLLRKNYLKFVKKTSKNMPVHQMVRLSDSAKILLRDLEIPNITEDIKQCAANLKELYVSIGQEEKTGNSRKVVEHLAWFLSETNADIGDVEDTVRNYIYSVNDYTYLSRLDNLIWKAENLFQTKKSLGQSKLHILMKNK